MVHFIRYKTTTKIPWNKVSQPETSIGRLRESVQSPALFRLEQQLTHGSRPLSEGTKSSRSEYFGKWGGWATFLCKEPFPPHQLGGAFDISSLPSPWKCCTCNHPSPLDCNQWNMLYSNTLEVWNILEASDLTLLKMFIFHSSIEGLARRASTLFLKNGIRLCNMSQTLFALT